MIIAILGRQPEIGRAELASLFNKNTEFFSKHSQLIETNQILTVENLGGSLKIAEVIKKINSLNKDDILDEVLAFYNEISSKHEGKITLGISAYDTNFRKTDIININKSLKSKSKNLNKSLRIIPNTDVALNTATSHHNKLGLSENKIEIIITQSKNETIIAKSLGSQNITALADRDQNRPKRDAFVGMLPPKLALIMINIALGEKIFESNSKKISILDPFCGTGVVLQEGFLRNLSVYGTDLSDKMIDYSKKNLEWIQSKNKNIKNSSIEVIEQADAMEFKWKYIKKIDAIICETYLGQPFSATPSRDKLEQVRKNCNYIITSFLKNIKPQLKKETTLCIAIPAWRDIKTKRVYKLPLVEDKKLESIGFIKENERDLLYYRDDQVVARNILKLSLKK